MGEIFKKLANKTGLATLFCALAIAVPAIANTPEELSNIDRQALLGGTRAQLAYVETGNNALDQMSEDGLFGLGRVLYKRTTVENLLIQRGTGGTETNQSATAQAMPVGVDPASDDLAFYPFIYWAIDPGQSQLSEAAIANLNAYMRNGGMLFIDTRDLSTNNRGRAWLRRAEERGLNVPPLQRVDGCDNAREECHVVGKSFFLLQDFPGRYAGGDLWAERTSPYRNDGVATVLVGGNEYAAAWAMDANEQPLYPVIGNDPEQREMSYRVGINLIMYALTGNYKNDQIHIPAIIQRMENNH